MKRTRPGRRTALSGLAALMALGAMGAATPTEAAAQGRGHGITFEDVEAKIAEAGGLEAISAHAADIAGEYSRVELPQVLALAAATGRPVDAKFLYQGTGAEPDCIANPSNAVTGQGRAGFNVTCIDASGLSFQAFFGTTDAAIADTTTLSVSYGGLTVEADKAGRGGGHIWVTSGAGREQTRIGYGGVLPGSLSALDPAAIRIADSLRPHIREFNGVLPRIDEALTPLVARDSQPGTFFLPDNVLQGLRLDRTIAALDPVVGQFGEIPGLTARLLPTWLADAQAAKADLDGGAALPGGQFAKTYTDPTTGLTCTFGYGPVGTSIACAEGGQTFSMTLQHDGGLEVTAATGSKRLDYVRIPGAMGEVATITDGNRQVQLGAVSGMTVRHTLGGRLDPASLPLGALRSIRDTAAGPMTGYVAISTGAKVEAPPRSHTCSSRGATVSVGALGGARTPRC